MHFETAVVEMKERNVELTTILSIFRTLCSAPLVGGSALRSCHSRRMERAWIPLLRSQSCAGTPDLLKPDVICLDRIEISAEILMFLNVFDCVNSFERLPPSASTQSTACTDALLQLAVLVVKIRHKSLAHKKKRTSYRLVES